MTALTELETHRRLITNQIKREICHSRNEIRAELLMRTTILENKCHELQKAVNTLTEKLIELAI